VHEDLYNEEYDETTKEEGQSAQSAAPSPPPAAVVTVLASRDIAAGEEIYTTYNRCEDCVNRHLWYGTPELLRDYGFVERYPQRWVFWHGGEEEEEEEEEEATIFDIDHDEDGDGDLKLTWVEGYKLASKNVPFFAGQLQRLRNLGETVFATTTTKDHPDIPEHEWQILSEFREAYVTAIRMALDDVASTTGHGGGGGGSSTNNHDDDQSCTEAGS